MTKERTAELVEIFIDADNRSRLSEAQLGACPSLEEAMEAAHGH